MILAIVYIMCLGVVAVHDELQYLHAIAGDKLDDGTAIRDEAQEALLAQTFSADAFRAAVGNDVCYHSGKCARLVLLSDASKDQDGALGLRFRSCGVFNLAKKCHRRMCLPERQAFGRQGLLMWFDKKKIQGRWASRDGYYVSSIYAQIVKVSDSRAGMFYHHGRANMTSNAAHHPPLDDTKLAEIVQNEEKGYMSGGAALGALDADGMHTVMRQIREKLSKNEALMEGKEVRFIVDLQRFPRTNQGETPQKMGQAMCPKTHTGGTFSAEDHFKLMIFSAGSTCKAMELDEGEAAPEGTQLYCLSHDDRTFDGPLRSWAVNVDLQQATPIVRNPKLEPNGGKAYMNLQPEVLAADPSSMSWFKPPIKTIKTVSEALQREPFASRCRFASFSPTQWKNEASAKQAANARVIVNSNFFFFLDVRDVACATPYGPVVSDGEEVMTLEESEKILAPYPPKNIGFYHRQGMTVLIMLRGYGAAFMSAHRFPVWFQSLSGAVRNNVTVVTGHQILSEAGPHPKQWTTRPLKPEGFDLFEEWWERKQARTTVGIQYDGMCQPPMPTDRRCGSKLVLVAFEMQSTDNKGQVTTELVNPFNPDEPASNTRDRPKSTGATIPQVQDVMSFMMMDAAMNLDSSGSSAMWTDLGSSIGGDHRSQPSDKTSHKACEGLNCGFQFRPSPSLLGFA